MQEDVYQGDGLNLYGSCHNNPKIYYDLSGFVPLNKKDFMLMFHMIMVRKSYYIGITNGLKR